MSGSTQLEARWQTWLEHNLSRGCDPEDLLRILLIKHGFPIDAIRRAMGSAFPAYSALLEAVPEALVHSDAAALVDHVGLTQVRFTRTANKVESDKLQLYVMDEFLAHSECDDLIALIDTRLRPSTITRPSSDPEFRTSTTCDLSHMDDPRVLALDERISAALGIHKAYAEGNQAQRYDVGQQFKPHTDFFQPDTVEFDRYAKARGNRTWTFMVYLNQTPRGGGTRFVNIDQVFYPLKGRAVAWNNLRADGSVNPDTRHCGEPVEEGCKIIVTKWFRERGAGPMFRDAT